MITCTECGRTNGTGQIGTSWICEDCKVEKADRMPQADPEEASSEEEDGEANGR